MPKVVIGRGIIDQAAASPKVKQALRDKRDRILPRAKRIAYSEGAKEFGDSLRAEDGVRPGTKSSGGYKRPFSRVIATSADATAREHGDVGVSKQAILRRAMGA